MYLPPRCSKWRFDPGPICLWTPPCVVWMCQRSYVRLTVFHDFRWAIRMWTASNIKSDNTGDLEAFIAGLRRNFRLWFWELLDVWAVVEFNATSIISRINILRSCGFLMLWASFERFPWWRIHLLDDWRRMCQAKWSVGIHFSCQISPNLPRWEHCLFETVKWWLSVYIVENQSELIISKWTFWYFFSLQILQKNFNSN